MRLSIALLILVALVAAAPAQAGWSFRQATSTTGGSEAFSADAKTSVGDGEARMEFGGAMTGGMFGPGSYMLLRTSEPKGAFLVDPTQRTYSRFDPEGMQQMMAPVAMGGQESGFGMKIADARVEKLLEEPGEELQGLPTTHYRYRKSYTLIMAMGPMESATGHEIVEDVWATTAIDLGQGALGEVLKVGSSGGVSVGAELEKLEQERPAGFVLKRVTVDHSTPQSKGMMARMMKGVSKEETVTSTFEILDLTQEELDPAFFGIPEGFAERQLMQPGAQAPDLEGARGPDLEDGN
jgi:hypothetical protein